MRVALVGYGYWGSKLLRNLTDLLGNDQVVLIDVNLDRLESACVQHPGITIRTELDEALHRDGLDAVVVATPAESHAELTTRCLEADCHVLVEKPLATSVEAARHLVALAEERDRTLMVGHTFLFSPRVEWIAGHIQSGQAGEIRYVMSSRLNLGLHRVDANVIWDLAPHDFSIIFHLLGEMPLSVQTSAQSVTRAGLPDVAFTHLTFPSGAIASVSVSWMAPRKVRNTVIVGSESMIVYDDTDADEPVKVHNKGVVLAESSSFGEHQLTYRYGDTISPFIGSQEPLSRQLAHFLATMDSGTGGLSDGHFGLQVVEALEAADRSWQLGGLPVELAGAATYR